MNDEDVIEQLQWQVITLNDTMNTLHHMINEQQPTIDTLEDVILASKQEVRVASTTIVLADHYQTSRNYYYAYAVGFLASVGTTIALLLLL
jgi:t-SNARE complex subunit (syntaxin)